MYPPIYLCLVVPIALIVPKHLVWNSVLDLIKKLLLLPTGNQPQPVLQPIPVPSRYR
jgi:hypothetical protein